MEASHPQRATTGELADLGRATRRVASWTLAAIVSTLALSGWPAALLDGAIVYLVVSPPLWHRLAQRARAGVALGELFVTPAVLSATAMDIAIVIGALQCLLLARVATHGGERCGRAVTALLAGAGCGTLAAYPIHALLGVSALTPVPVWHLALVVAWAAGFGCALALLSHAQGRRSVAAQHRAAQKARVLAVLAQRLGRYLAPQVRASLFAEVARQADVAVTELTASCAVVRHVPRRRWLTVFFSDIVGFTALTETLAPEEVAALLNAYLEAMTAIALDHGGTIDKFIGDGIMVFFGDPASRGRAADALACARMALAMQARIGELAARAAALGVAETLRVRMGIASGICTVGDFGAEHRLDYTALGRAVNLASRLQSAAAPATVVLSAGTAALLGGALPTRALGQLRLPGVALPVDAFLVESVPPAPAARAPITREIDGGVRLPAL